MSTHFSTYPLSSLQIATLDQNPGNHQQSLPTLLSVQVTGSSNQLVVQTKLSTGSSPELVVRTNVSYETFQANIPTGQLNARVAQLEKELKAAQQREQELTARLTTALAANRPLLTEQEYIVLAEDYMQRKDYQNALTFLESSIHLNPSAKAYLLYAKCLGDPTRADESIAYANKALELDPKSFSAKWHILNKLHGLSRIEEALEKVEQYLANEPNLIWFSEMKVQCLFDLKRPADCRRAINSLKKVDPNNEYILQYTAKLNTYFS